MKKTHYIMEFLLVALLVAADQITKYLAVRFLKGNDGISLIPGVFKLYFLEGGNSGAAFGLLQGKFWFFLITTFLVLLAILWVLIRMPRERRFKPLRLTLLVLAAGAIGNYIDRIYTYLTEGYNYVIDFLYFELIDFPIFNVADCYVTVASAALFCLCLFFYKEEDLDRLFSAVTGKHVPSEMISGAEAEEKEADDK